MSGAGCGLGLQDSVVDNHILYGKSVILLKLKPLLSGVLHIGGESVKMAY